jgi:ABC-type uncharacterized transport system fused permease/ATPase subunit
LDARRASKKATTAFGLIIAPLSIATKATPGFATLRAAAKRLKNRLAEVLRAQALNGRRRRFCTNSRFTD